MTNAAAAARTLDEVLQYFPKCYALTVHLSNPESAIYKGLVTSRLQNLESLVNHAKLRIFERDAYHALQDVYVGIDDVRKATQDSAPISEQIDEFADLLDPYLDSISTRIRRALALLDLNSTQEPRPSR